MTLLAKAVDSQSPICSFDYFAIYFKNSHVFTKVFSKNADKSAITGGAAVDKMTFDPQRSSNMMLIERFFQKLRYPQIAFVLILMLVNCKTANFSSKTPSDAPDTSQEFKQVSYTPDTASYTQGFHGIPSAESFTVIPAELDILVVVDNSRSMQEYHTNLASKLEPLLSHVAHAAWQIKIIHTDYQQDNCLPPRVIKKGDARATETFSELVYAAGTSGSGEEEGIAQAVKGLKCEAAPWLRPKSAVAVLIVSDEDNCSEGNQCKTSENDPTAAPLKDYLSSIRRYGQNARVYGIITPPTGCLGNGNKPGLVYAGIINESNGQYGSICDSDYTATLKAISSNIASTLGSQFELSNEPAPGSVEVLIDGKKVDGFSVTGSTLQLAEGAPDNSVVDIRYKHSFIGTYLEEFPLAKKPIIDTIKISINNKELAGDAFKYDVERNTVIFNEIPARDDNIKIDYKEDAPLQNVFKVDVKVNPATIRVFVDGVPTSPIITYDEATDSITLDPAPPANSTVKIIFKEKFY